MKIIHALEPLQKSVMLIGPTPRSADVPSWRPDAIKIFETLAFDGILFIPEAADWKAHDNYDAQINWELEAINQATVAMCWLPRTIETMPGFTTNVEFGHLATSGKLLFGHPKGADKVSYLRSLASRYHIPTYDSLESLVLATVKQANQIHQRTMRHAHAR
jgi:hypothetical protein